MTKREKAADLHRQGIELQERGLLKEAIERYEEAVARDPSWAAPLFNLGLVFKRQRAWRKSLDYSRRATELDRKHEGAWWNLGIAATALGDWKAARAAWRGFGIKLPDGTGPVDLPCGFGPIRLNPDGDAEIVWTYRLDPARAELASIPFPESNHRWRDVVLNDGEPVGYRQHQGRSVPVLNALQLLVPSSFGTYVARVEMTSARKQATHVDRLGKVATEREGCAEDWSTSTRILCKACSEGRVHDRHDTEAPRPDQIHLIGIAARSRDHASDILHAWEAEQEDIHVESLEDALKPESFN